MTEPRVRMSAEERREQIIDVTVELLQDHGAQVTTRQIAEAAGIAEGTIFRSFDDKDELIDAAVWKVVDPRPGLAVIEAVDSTQPFADFLAEVVRIQVERTARIAGFMHAIGASKQPKRHFELDAETKARIHAIFEPYRSELRIEPAAMSRLLRAVVMGSVFHQGDTAPLTADQIVDVLLSGVVSPNQEN